MKSLSRYSKFLLGVIALTSLFSLVVTPPFQSPDEADHFKRIVQLGSGRAAVVTPPGETSGDYLDKSVMRVIEPFAHLPRRQEQRVDKSHFERAYQRGELSGETEFVSFPGSLSYAPWSYPGQVIGYVTSSLFTNNMLLRFYASRLGALALALVLLCVALKLLPVERWPLLSLVLVAAPFAMFQMGAAVPDALLVPGSLLFCVGCAAFREGRLRLPVVIGLSAVLFLIVGSKPPMLIFFVLLLASLWETPQKFSVTATVWGVVILMVVGSLLWFAYALPQIQDLRYERVAAAAQKLKKDQVLRDPFYYGFLGLRVFVERFWGYFGSLYGQMGSLDAGISKFHRTIGRVLFLWAFFVSLIPLALGRWRSSQARTRLVDLMILPVGAAYVVGVMIALYLSWSLVGPEHMGDGVQGRYFYPLFALPVFASLGMSTKSTAWRVFFWIAVANAPFALTVTLVRRYYGS
jgi:uncharacterized membrane protein